MTSTSYQPFTYAIENVKGFLDPAEGEALHKLAFEAALLGPILEVGSYCGKSTHYLGFGAQQRDGQVFALDHHRGSEEHQLGEGYHDPDLYDAEVEAMDSLPYFRRVIRRAGLEDTIVPVVADSATAARYWATPLAMVFIDGGHSLAQAMTDWRSWGHHVIKGGTLAIHDIFENPEEGGQAPFEIYKMALASGLYENVDRVKTLAVLRRI